MSVADKLNAVKRPPVRPESPAVEDPREAARRRAAEIRGHIGDMDQGVDEFRAPPAPPGWEYEWKTKSVMNQENHSYITQLRHTGWEFVPTERHPEMMPEGGKHPIIERKGMVLMERPKEINDEVRNIELRKAQNQVRHKVAQITGETPAGNMERTLHKVNSKYEPMPIPEN